MSSPQDHIGRGRTPADDGGPEGSPEVRPREGEVEPAPSQPRNSLFSELGGTSRPVSPIEDSPNLHRGYMSAPSASVTSRPESTADSEDEVEPKEDPSGRSGDLNLLDSRPMDNITVRRSTVANRDDAAAGLGPLVAAAALNLTNEQRELIDRRQSRVDASASKGKAADPLNWGGITFDEFERDPELQRAAFESLRNLKDARDSVSSSTSTRSDVSYPRTGAHQPSKVPAIYRPASQIPPTSFLGSTLANARRAASQIPAASCAYTVPGASAGTATQNAAMAAQVQNPTTTAPVLNGVVGAQTQNAMVAVPVIQAPVQAPHGGFNVFKLIKPSSYDGRVDIREFNRFAKESTAFVHHCKIPADQAFLVLSHFLKKKAYDFYIQKVSLDESAWTLDTFFSGLFDYCFPLGFLANLRTELEQCRQGNRSVSEFSYVLHELFVNIGDISEKEKARRLFKGLKPSIQVELYRGGLNEEVSTWDEVLTKAEMVEISEKAMNQSIQSNSNRFRGQNDRGSSRREEHHGSQNRGNTSAHNASANPSNSSNAKGGSAHHRSSSVRPGSSKTNNNRTSNGPRWGKTLSDKEKKELIAAGKCFRCKNTGHMSRNCAEANKVQGSSKRPPGVSTFNIEVVNAAEEEAAPSLDVLESFPLGSLSWDLEDDGKGFEPLYFEYESTDDPNMLRVRREQAVDLIELMVHTETFEERLRAPSIPVEFRDPDDVWTPLEPRWKDHKHSSFPRLEFGDAPALVIAYELNIAQPYPNDDRFVENVWINEPGARFHVSRHLKWRKGYQIIDEMTGFVVNLPRKYVENPRFDVTAWYATKRSKAFGGGRTKWWARGMTLDDPYETVAEAYLTEMAHACLPMVRDNMEYEARFQVVLKSETSSSYLIRDGDLRTEIEIPAVNLRDPKFHLGEWYCGLPEVMDAFREANRAVLHLDDGFSGMVKKDPEPGVPLIPKDGDYRAKDIELLGERKKTPWDSSKAGLLAEAIEGALQAASPYPIEALLSRPREKFKRRFEARIEYQGEKPDMKPMYFVIYDWMLRTESGISLPMAMNPDFSPAKWYAAQSARKLGHSDPYALAHEWMVQRGPPFAWQSTVQNRVRKTLNSTLTRATPFELDFIRESGLYRTKGRFVVDYVDGMAPHYSIWDRQHLLESYVVIEDLVDAHLDLVGHYELLLADHHLDPEDFEAQWHSSIAGNEADELLRFTPVGDDELDLGLSCFVVGSSRKGKQVDKDKYPAVERNASLVRNDPRIIPRPIIVEIKLDGKPCRALIDSGSFGDFVSTTLVDQLKLKLKELPTELNLHMAVQGSRSKIKYEASVRFQYQSINESREFYVANLNSYDVILGTPWLHQHQVCIGLNPARVAIGSIVSLPIEKGPDTKVLVQAMSLGDRDAQQRERVRKELHQYALKVCKAEEDIGLPPLRAINHEIPLIDETKVYSWRPSRCPEAFRDAWAEKRDAYLKSGKWEITSAANSMPMLMIPKPRKDPSQPVQLRTVVDLRERNKNTRKMTSPLPDIDSVLRRAASRKYVTVLDLKNAFEQIRVVPEHVHRTAVTTPDGNMVSHVVQMGDCNAPATQQALMNYLFSEFLARWLDVFLDDLIVTDDDILEHVSHVKTVVDILEREKLYLSEAKMRFLTDEVVLLGRLVDREGIKMDPAKVESVIAWKVPTNRDLLRGFLGAVGYLADDVPGVRIPMGVLSSLTGDTVPFRWGHTEQRAFEEVKSLVHSSREHHRVPVVYGQDAPPVWVVTDGCATGISGLVSQGEDWRSAKVAAFYSAKLNAAQQNYAVHEIEMLAGVETMLRYKDVLLGVKFSWVTDHKGLIYILNQKNLSPRQARWLEKISPFDFEVVYVPGSENVLADALSRIYSNEAPGTVRTTSEYTQHDVWDEDNRPEVMMILAGIEARVPPRRSARIKALPAETGRKETSREFAARMRPVFSLKGPMRREEGGRAEGSKEPDHNEPPVEKDVPRPSILDVVRSLDEGIDFFEKIKLQGHEDAFFKSILTKPDEHRNFEARDGLVYLKTQGTRRLYVPKVIIAKRSAREIIISEAHSLLAHLGFKKTLAYLREHVWWKDIVSDVKAYCESCSTCKRTKPNNQAPYGLLNSLPVPSCPWEAIGIDFVGPLPESTNRHGKFDEITVIIDLFSGMVHLVPSRSDYKAKELAELMFENVYRLHGIPQRIISDRDTLFTSGFWSQLHKLLNSELRMSSAYHPETDGSTERANRTVTQMLRQCVKPNQTDWVSRLPAIEFAVNCARSDTTGFAPFFLNYGRMPRSMVWNAAPKDEFPAVRRFAEIKKAAIMEAHDSILAARVKQTRNANRGRRQEPFTTGDLVYISTENIQFPKGLARKLIPKYVGPYRIDRDFGNHSFRIDLPSSLKRRGVHDVFHASKLRPHVPNDDRRFPGRLDSQLGPVLGEEGEWAIDKIVSHSGSSKNAVFEVRWKSGDTTWTQYEDLAGTRAMATYLETQEATTVDNLKMGTGDPPDDDPQAVVGLLVIGDGIWDDEITEFCWEVEKGVRGELRSILASPILLSLEIDSPANYLDMHKRKGLYTMDEYFGKDYWKRKAPRHPSFKRISEKMYLITANDGVQGLMDIHQISLCCDVAATLGEMTSGWDTENSPSTVVLPIGYEWMAEVWNADRSFRVGFPEIHANGTLTTGMTIIQAHDFHITPQNLGIIGGGVTEDSYRDLAVEVAEQAMRRKARAAEKWGERQLKRERASITFGPKKKKQRTRRGSEGGRGRREKETAESEDGQGTDDPDRLVVHGGGSLAENPRAKAARAGGRETEKDNITSTEKKKTTPMATTTTSGMTEKAAGSDVSTNKVIPKPKSTSMTKANPIASTSKPKHSPANRSTTRSKKSTSGPLHSDISTGDTFMNDVTTHIKIDDRSAPKDSSQDVSMLDSDGYEKFAEDKDAEGDPE